MEGGLGGELARRFEDISFVLVSPEHMKSTPRTSWFSGCLYLPLSYLIRIIRFVLFGIIECGQVYILSKGKPISSQKGKITSSHHTHLQRVFQWFRSWLSDWLVVCFQPTNRPYIQPKRLHHPEPKTTKRPGLSDLFSHSSSGVVF